MSAKTIWHTYICSHICQSGFIKDQWLKNMKLLRGANLWLKNNSNSAPFGPHGAWISFWKFNESVSSWSLLSPLLKKKKNMEMISHLRNFFFPTFTFSNIRMILPRVFSNRYSHISALFPVTRMSSAKQRHIILLPSYHPFTPTFCLTLKVNHQWKIPPTLALPASKEMAFIIHFSAFSLPKYILSVPIQSSSLACRGSTAMGGGTCLL